MLLTCRLGIFIVRFFVSVILLLGISFTSECTKASINQFQALAGVLSYDDSFLNTTHANLLQMQAYSTLGVANDYSILNRPTLLGAPSDDCPFGRAGCFSQFFLQKLQVKDADLNWPPQATGFVELHHVSIYQMFLTAYGWTQRPPEACKLYGWRSTRLEICAESSQENQRKSVLLDAPFKLTLSNLRKGASVCISTSNDPNHCEKRRNWRRYPTIAINVWKRYADLTYFFPNRSVTNEPKNVSGNISIDVVSVDDYFRLYDTLFPSYMETEVAPHEVSTYLLNIVAELGYQMQFRRQLELYYLPWLMQNADLSSVSDLPEENIVTATSCQSVNKFQLAQAPVAIFLSFNIFILFWCLWRLFQIHQNPPPPLSSFPDIDLVEMLEGDRG